MLVLRGAPPAQGGIQILGTGNVSVIMPDKFQLSNCRWCLSSVHRRNWILPLCCSRHPCYGTVADSVGPIAIEIPQLQFIVQVLDVLVAQVQQIRAKSWETVEIPQLQHVFSWTSCCSPVVCNNSAHGRWCSSSMVVNVPVVMRYSGSAPDSGHRELGGPSSSEQRLVFDSWAF